MARPFTLIQLSDPHSGADWAAPDPQARLAAAVTRVKAALARRPPDAVLITGDLTDHATDAEYERVRELLAPLGVPVHVLPGNRDDRASLRSGASPRGARQPGVSIQRIISPSRSS